MKITYNLISNKTYVNIYISDADDEIGDIIQELQQKYSHIAIFRSGSLNYKETLKKFLKSLVE